MKNIIIFMDLNDEMKEMWQLTAEVRAKEI
jgi:hypothetical protein